MEDFFKKTGWTSVITSAITALLGIIIIAKPIETVNFIAYILGSIFILFGILKIINYFVAKGSYDFYNYEIIFGILAIIIGIVTIAYSNTIQTIFRILIGIWILYSSLIRFGFSLKLKKLDIPAWKYALFIAILILICGIYVLTNAETIGLALGVSILIYSFMDIIEGLIFLKNVDSIF